MISIRWIVLATVCLADIQAVSIKPMLIGGIKAGADEWKSIITIKTNVSSGCLATVVGPRTFLTAATCSSTGSVGTFVINGKTYSAKIFQSPLYFKEEHSLAVGVTTEDIPLPPVSVSAQSPTSGTEVMLVGTGCTAAGPATDPGLFAAKSLISAIKTRVFNTSASSGPFLCKGDLGSPAFIQTGSGWEMMGVNYRVDVDTSGKITGPNYSARLDGSEHRGVMQKIATDNSVEICGINKTCGGVTPPNDPTCSLSAAPPTVRLGEAVSLSISTTNALSAKIDGNNVAVPIGSYTYFPPNLGSQTALGTATSSTGKVATCSAPYTVVPKNDPGGSVSCTLTATPKKLVVGEIVTLEITASAAATNATIDGVKVNVPSDKLAVKVTKKGDLSAVGFVSGAGASANCYADYRVDDGGVPPTIPNYGLVMSYCGPDSNGTSTGISRVCVGTLKKDPAVNHTGFTQAIHVRYADGTAEVLPVVAKRPVGTSASQEEWGLFANGVASGNSGATIDMRLATVSKAADGTPSQLEGNTRTNKRFRATLTAQ
jgi:hypothetical protein